MKWKKLYWISGTMPKSRRTKLKQNSTGTIGTIPRSSSLPSTHLPTVLERHLVTRRLTQLVNVVAIVGTRWYSHLSHDRWKCSCYWPAVLVLTTFCSVNFVILMTFNRCKQIYVHVDDLICTCRRKGDEVKEL